jgi:stress-induced morphogen
MRDNMLVDLLAEELLGDFHALRLYVYKVFEGGVTQILVLSCYYFF